MYAAGDSDRVAGDRAVFNTQDRTATFYDASGPVTPGEALIERGMFGTQEPDMLFYGEVIEKLGPRSYRLTRGGFFWAVNRSQDATFYHDWFPRYGRSQARASSRWGIRPTADTPSG